MMFMVAAEVTAGSARLHTDVSEGFLTRAVTRGRITRSRIRPTTSHTTAPSPQLKSAFLVSAFSPVNFMIPLSTEKTPRSTASAPSRTKLTSSLSTLASRAISSAPIARNSAATTQSSQMTWAMIVLALAMPAPP